MILGGFNSQHNGGCNELGNQSNDQNTEYRNTEN